jgi:peroxiredoxin
MPEMQKFYERSGNLDVTILAVNATNTETGSAAVRDWLQNKGFMFPVVFDSSGEITRIYKVSAFPTTFIIRPGGFVYKKHQGPMNETMLREAVRK